MFQHWQVGVVGREGKLVESGVGLAAADAAQPVEVAAETTAAGIEGKLAAAAMTDPGTEALLAHTVAEIGSADPVVKVCPVRRTSLVGSKCSDPVACSQGQVQVAADQKLLLVEG